MPSVSAPYTNDYSNPQQGTETTITMKNKSEAHSVGSGDKHTNLVSAKNSDEYTDDPAAKKEIRKLFVGGLPTDITEPEFRSFFEQFGELQDSVVMFDRETHRSRGFGFITYVDPDVAKSLLRMGDHDDGVGRLVMRGKTCEVKAATPKGEGSSRGGRTSRGGGQNRDNRKHDAAAAGYSHIHGPFSTYSEHVYPAVMHEDGTYPLNPPFQGYPGTAAAGAGVPTFMTQMYYHPSGQYPHAPAALVMPTHGEFASTAGNLASQPFYSMAPPTLNPANFQLHPSAAIAGPLNSPSMSQGIHHQHHHTMPLAHSQQAAYTFVPVVPMFPGVGTPVPPPGGVQSSSVMQPVAPGIPYKQSETNYEIDGVNATQNQEVGTSE